MTSAATIDINLNLVYKFGRICSNHACYNTEILIKLLKFFLFNVYKGF